MGSDFIIDFACRLVIQKSIMARKPRIEYPGAFFHIIARGNNRQDIFHDNEDRHKYLNRLAFYFGEGGVILYCFCLMTNHIHLLLEMGERPISRVLQRLHTWYVRYHNQKYERVGHLFQGRYKAVLCDKDAYLLELVRYIHLNPVRAGIVKDPGEYSWSSHSVYLGLANFPFLNTEFVLSQFANNMLYARKLYEDFVLARVSEGRREDLYKLTNQSILGKEAFVAKVMELSGTKTSQPMSRRLHFDLPTLQMVVEKALDLPQKAMLDPKRSAVLARRMFCYVARESGGFKAGEVADYLGKDMATITQGVRYITLALREKSAIRDKVNRVIAEIERGQTTFQDRIGVLKAFFIERERPIRLAYLFGSAARDRMGALSDVDIAVLYVGKVDWDYHFDLTYEMQRLLGIERVDLIVLNSVSVELAYACIKEGVLLYAGSIAVRVEFETKVLNLYGDLVSVLRRQRLEIVESSNERRTRRYYKALGETERMLSKTRTPSGEEPRGFRPATLF